MLEIHFIKGRAIMNAIVVTPVTDVRAERKFRSERVHQLVFGEIVEILEDIQILEKFDYIFVRDVRLDYKGYVNKNTLYFMSEEEYKQIIKFKMIKVSVPFCRISGPVNFLLPFGSRLYTENGKDFFMPNGFIYNVVDEPNENFNSVVELALQMIGIPYLWGGTSSYGFDCSGFVNRLYDVALNVDMPRDASDQENRYPKIATIDEQEKLMSGDLLYMEGHVMMYIGDGKIVHANGHNMCVSITSLNNDEYGKYLKSRIRKVCRVCST
ncbi:C40 family peptidase [Fervidobacterium pennivorans subsp. shakshaketiis]|uniref:Cell wall-associated hydrolase, invasion-associated protein n=1 Tax=Fervidobacterium pennivorans (strain DSM 9078 / Ven5) TaxID=771875 RepID=H9UCR0_FERPD|nr:C40 family peptidase [Fervidobacterium pennivorans]AFG35303.1 cell wall-associated hydrolase, invasion-associated protein [Fervidobacterium pennivorans DSM 9078]